MLTRKKWRRYSAPRPPFALTHAASKGAQRCPATRLAATGVKWSVATLVFAFSRCRSGRSVYSRRFSPATSSPKPTRTRSRTSSSDGVQWCVNRGMEMKIVPYQKIPLPTLYQEATEKYSAQVKLKDDQTLEGLRRRAAVSAGRRERPAGGDEADVQLRAHPLLHRRPRAPPLRRRHRPAQVDRDGNQHYNVERHFVLDWLRVLQFTGRLHHRSEAGDRAQQGPGASAKPVSTRSSSRST